MSFPKEGRIFPKKGNNFPEGSSHADYAAVIAVALRKELGGTHRAVKTIVGWTGASERTVKNWLAGKAGPRGEHLIALAHHSGAVLEAFLILAGKGPTAPASELIDLRDA